MRCVKLKALPHARRLQRWFVATTAIFWRLLDRLRALCALAAIEQDVMAMAMLCYGVLFYATLHDAMRYCTCTILYYLYCMVSIMRRVVSSCRIVSCRDAMPCCAVLIISKPCLYACHVCICVYVICIRLCVCVCV